MNYLSKPYQVEQPVQRGDINFDYTILNTLQSKYDANKAIVDQALAQYESLKGLRDVDNQYIAQKVTEVKAEIDKFGSFNLAHGTTRDSILNTLNTVIKDPIVKDAVMSKAVYDNYNAEVSKLKEKNPEKYSDMNYQYGLYTGGFYDYMQGKTNKLGSISYTPYTDLTEEHLKKLKTIKDIKGKKFIETPDGKGGIIRREIDGLEDHEIRQYLGSTFTPQELQQLQINSWGQFGGNNIEQYRDNIIGQYTQYTNGEIDRYQKEKNYQDSIANNSSFDQVKRDNAARLSKEYQEYIDDIKQQDLSKMATQTIAFQLGKTNYLNGISQLAKSEWSTEYKKDDVWFANENLDIQRQKLELDKADLELKYREKGLLPNGDIDSTQYVSREAMETELAKELGEEGTGYGNLQTERNNAYNNFLLEANKKLENASNEDVKTITESLKRRGIIKQGNTFRFEDPSNYNNKSIVDSVYQAYKDVGMENYQMEESYNIKNQKGKQINEVVVPAYQKVFNKQPDKYIEKFKQMRDDLQPLISIVSDITGGEKQIELQKNIDNFVNRAGGWKNLKNSLQSNPSLMTEFAELTDQADKTYKGLDPYIKTALSNANVFSSVLGVTNNRTIFDLSDINLKEEAKQEIETAIQNKNASTGTFTAYNQFNIINNDLRDKLSKMIPAGTVLNVSDGGEGSPSSLMFKKDDNITVRKVGDKVYIDQVEVRGSGKNEAHVTKRFVAEKGGDVYNEISKYINLEKFTTVYRNTADRNTEPITTNVKLFDGQGIGAEKIKGEVFRNMPNDFSNTGMTPERLATKSSADTELNKLAFRFGIPQEQVVAFKNRLFEKINNYKYTISSTHNPRTNRFEFYTKVEDIDGREVIGNFLGTDVLNGQIEFSLKKYPQVFIINTLASKAIEDYNNNKNLNNTLQIL